MKTKQKNGVDIVSRENEELRFEI